MVKRRHQIFLTDFCWLRVETISNDEDAAGGRGYRFSSRLIIMIKVRDSYKLVGHHAIAIYSSLGRITIVVIIIHQTYYYCRG